MLSLPKRAGRRFRTSQLVDRSLMRSPHSRQRRPRCGARRRAHPSARQAQAAGSAAAAGATPASRQARTRSTAPQGNPPQQDQQPLPRIRTGINYVRVDAIVTDRQGNPVLDLKQDEFRIKEDGKPQVDRVVLGRSRSIRSPSRSTARRRARFARSSRSSARPSARMSGCSFILLDDYHVRRGNDMVRAQAAHRLHREPARPADMVAIMYPLTPITGLTFTRNRASLISAIEHFEGRRFDYTAAQRVRGALRVLSRGDGRADPQPGRDDRAQGRGRFASEACARGASRSSSSAKASPRILPPQLNDPVAAMPGIGNSARATPTAARTPTGRSGPRRSTWSRT